MEKNNNSLLRKPEIRFWLAIIGLVATGVVSFNTLRMKVLALEKTKEEVHPKIEQVLINQAKMQKDIDYIKKEIDNK